MRGDQTRGHGEEPRHAPLIIAAALLWFSLFTYVSLLTPYVESRGASHAQAGIIVGSFGFIQVFLRIPSGILSDRWGRRKIFILLSFLFSFISAAGFLLARAFPALVLARTLAGIGATFWVHFNVLYPAYFRAGRSAQAVGILNATAMGAQTLALLAGGLVAEYFSIQAVFGLSAVTALLGLAVASLIREDGGRRIDRQARSTIFREMANPGLLTIAAFAILVQILTYAVTFGFIPVYAVKRFGVGASGNALLTVVATIAGAVSSLIGNTRLVRRSNEMVLALAGILTCGLASAATALAPNLPALIILQAISGLGRGVAFTLAMAMAIQCVPEERRATAMGFYQASYGIGMVAGPVIMGGLADTWGLGPSFAAMGLGVALLALALYPAYLQCVRPQERSAS